MALSFRSASTFPFVAIGVISIALASCGSAPSVISSGDTPVVSEQSAQPLEQSTGSATPEAVSIAATSTTTAPTELIVETEVIEQVEEAAETTSPKDQSLAPAPESGDLRDVDLGNDIMFVNHYGENELFGPATNGEFLNGDRSSPDFFAFFVGEPVFVDLDSDGADEALVASAWNGGGSGYFSELRAFDIRDGYVVEVAVMGYGDRAFGGIDEVKAAADGRTAIVDVFLDGDGACCPHTMLQQRIALSNGELVVAEEFDEIRYLNLYNEGITEVEFLPGTSRAMLAMFANSTESVLFDAVAGDQLDLTTRSGPDVATAKLTHVRTGQTQDILTSATLPEDGLYELMITTSADAQVSEIPGWTTIEMSISS